MRSVRAQKEIIIPETVSVLLNELEEEMQNTQKLLAQLRLPELSQDQAEVVLGELSSTITHLHEHTRGLDEIILEAKLKKESKIE